MSLDGKLLSNARERLKQRIDARDAMYEARKARVYSKAPHIAETDRALASVMTDALSAAFLPGGDLASAMEIAQLRANELMGRRSSELAAAGFDPDFLTEVPMCAKCGDTGYVGTQPCSCLMELYKEELHEELSSVLKIGSETFDTFDLSWYDDTYDPMLGRSVREHMESVYENCREYARKFKNVRYNLFLNGGTGLGKTFLSACIARDVSEAGFSVVYETASAMFKRFEEDKFERGENHDAKSQIRRYMNCDLLIIDDLGTELTTAFTISALYDLINTRLTTGKKTVISSNYSLEELRARYSPQIMSRLEGEYIVLRFYGDDIRLKRRGI